MDVFYINEDNPLGTFYNEIPIFHETFIKLVEKNLELKKAIYKQM